MLTFEDCVDFCNFTEEEVRALQEGENVPALEACIRAHGLADNPRGCRQLLKYMQERLEQVEARNDSNASREVHAAMEHFTSTHHYT
ncbi:MAG TPA: hypothetical protein PLZ16_13190 [Gammaproteobacteria bacterium]|nr:hypothetical protein [Gammaproteobacteria bacterium]